MKTVAALHSDASVLRAVQRRGFFAGARPDKLADLEPDFLALAFTL